MNFLPKIQRMQWEPNLGSVNYMFIKHSVGVFPPPVFIFTQTYTLYQLRYKHSHSLYTACELPPAFTHSTDSKYFIYTCRKQTWVLPSWSFTSVQFSCSVVSDSLRPHESQHTRPPCPSPTPGVHPDSRPLSQRCHPAISSSVVPFSSCPQSLPASDSFQWVNSSHEVAKVLEFQL